ncbi:MAG TPA: hypothetical protein VEC17_02965 [Candidatus Binatia bacterium]|nr:hypothetical protein [Candidatus Binatia bacterium]
METTLYYFLLFAHLVGLVIGFGAVLVIDAFGFFWLIKAFKVDLHLVRRVADITQRLIWVGFFLLVLTGIPMLAMKGVVSNLTIIKLFLVFMVGMNGVFLHYIKKGLDALGSEIINVPSRYYFRIGLASTISQLGWWGATLIGFYNRQIGHPMGWTEFYPVIIGLIILLIGTVSLVGETVTEIKK